MTFQTKESKALTKKANCPAVFKLKIESCIDGKSLMGKVTQQNWYREERFTMQNPLINVAGPTVPNFSENQSSLQM